MTDKDYQRAYYLRNRKVWIARSSKWQKENKERLNAYRRKRYHENLSRFREAGRKYTSAYRRRHPGRAALSAKKYRAAHPDRIIEKTPEQARRHIAKWRKTHPEQVKALRRLRRALKKGAAIGNPKAIVSWEKSWRHKKSVRCYWCGHYFPGNQCHADHIVPLSKNGSHSISNLVISCASCNCTKQDKPPEIWAKAIGVLPL